MKFRSSGWRSRQQRGWALTLAALIAAGISSPAFAQHWSQFWNPVTWPTDDGAIEDQYKPYGLAVGDLMGAATATPKDTWLDVVVVNNWAQSFAVFRNTQVWSAVQPTTSGLIRDNVYDLGRSPYGVALGDMDNDGDLDAVISLLSTVNNDDDPADAQVWVLRNNGNGFFTVPPVASDIIALPAVMRNAYGLALSDFNSDGRLDIVVAGYDRLTYCEGKFGGYKDTPRVEQIQQTNPGVFQVQTPPIRIPFGDSCKQGVATDVSPGRLIEQGTPARRDVAVAIGCRPENAGCGLNERKVAVLKNLNSDGNFSAQLYDGLDSYGITTAPIRAIPGRIDVLAGDLHNINLTHDDGYPYFNDGNGNLTLTPGTILSVTSTPPYNPYGVAAGTLDAGNNTVDVAFAMVNDGPWDHGCVAIMLGNGNGTFSPAVKLLRVDATDENPKPCFLRIADMDKDCRNDVIVSCTDSGHLSVVVNKNPTPPGCGGGAGGFGDGSEQESEDKSEEYPEEDGSKDDWFWNDSFGEFNYF